MMAKYSDFIKFLSTMLISICGVALSYAQQDYSDQRNCKFYRIESISIDSVRVFPQGDDDPINGKIAKDVDINFDGLTDLIICFSGAANSGNGIYGIYTQQADRRYRCVFEQDHWYSDKCRLLKSSVTIVNGNPWMDIALYSRSEVQGHPGIIYDGYLRFDGDKYQYWHLAKSSISSQVEAVLVYNGKDYMVERLLLKAGNYGPLTLSIYERDSVDQNQLHSRNIVAASNEGLEISDISVIQLKGRPYFFVKGRYQILLIDLEGEKITPPICPGVGVEFREDAISGQMHGFQFFDKDDYLLGIAVSYGVFCFNISDLNNPKELSRYSSEFSDHGQPYFFLEKNVNGSYNGIMSQSDTTKKSSFVSGFYTATKKARYLFQDKHLIVPQASYADPADYEIGRTEPFLSLYEKGANGKTTPWVVDLENGKLIKGGAAQLYLKKHPK